MMNTLMRLFIPLFLLLFFQLTGLSQDLYPLNHEEIDEVSFDFGGKRMIAHKHIFTLVDLDSFELISNGGGDGLKVDSLMIYNKTFNSATIKASFSRCVTSEYVDEEPGAYFVSIAFYDVDTTFVVGHSMVSKEGFSLAEPHTDLQATEMIPSVYYEDGVKCYQLNGEDEISIHQAFLYDPKSNRNGGIKPIHFVSIRLFSLGAG